MRIRAFLLAVVVTALTAAGAAADNGPPPGGHHGPPPGPPPAGEGEAPDTPGSRPKPPPRPGAAAQHKFTEELRTLGLTCMRRPLVLHGSLTAATADSLTLHPRRAEVEGRPDPTVKLIAATQIRRLGKPSATSADLVVGDMVEVLAVPCRTAGATAGTPPTLVAHHVMARPARTAKP